MGSVREHIRDDWPAVLFVPALIFALHHHNWLHAIDGYAFLLIGNLSAIVQLPDTTATQNARAVVVLIDSESQENRYYEHSPLPRCALLTDLRTIYAASPNLLAIDLDLSPAVWLGTRSKAACDKADSRLIDLPPVGPPNAPDELRCQHELYCLIQEKSRNGTGTVVMTPFKAADPRTAAEQNDWLAEMQRANVRFGRAELPAEYGLVIKQYRDSDTFADALYRQYRAQTEQQAVTATSSPTPLASRVSLERGAADRLPGEGVVLSAHTDSTTSLINPRVYASGLCPVPLVVRKPDSASEKRADTWCPLNDDPNSTQPFAQRLNSALKPLKNRVVFFGAGYGGDDTFLTPLGELYGVEIQAAAFLSRFLPVRKNELAALAGDVLLALLFSVLIAAFWSRYFKHRMSTQARERQLAVLYVAILIVCFILFVFATCAFSLELLRWRGIWLSPVPIAIGMLIDAFALGSVHEAIRVSTEQKLELVRRLKASHETGAFDNAANTELEQYQRHPSSGWDSLARFLVRDWRRLWKRQRIAATALIVKRGLWLFCVGYAAWLILFH
ncbi:MAG: CHASE2 domain-containing protein [Burkholderiales bacterium]